MVHAVLLISLLHALETGLDVALKKINVELEKVTVILMINVSLDSTVGKIIVTSIINSCMNFKSILIVALAQGLTHDIALSLSRSESR